MSPPDQLSPEIVDVVAWRPDGTVVSVLETGRGATGGAPVAPRLLDDVALGAIATAPELRTDWTGPITEPAPEPSDERAAQLTGVLAAANVLPASMEAVKVPGARVGALEFFVSQGGYKLAADLVDAAGEGHLFVNANDGAGGAVSCANVPNCRETTLPDGSPATVELDSQGDVTTIVLTTIRPGGMQLVLMSSNVSERAQNSAKEAPAVPATRPQPPLDEAALGRIAVLF
jgi:hypothetical protein